MLVRFLSYAASLIGARRYKPLLISCLVVLFTITGVSMVISTVVSDSPEASSQLGHTDQTTDKQQTSTNQLNGLEKKSPKDNQPLPSTSDNQNNTGTQNAQPSSNTPETSFELNVNTANLTLSQGSPNAAVTVSTERTAVQWTLSPETNSAGLGARLDAPKDKDNNGNAVVRFALDNPATPGTYQFTITAKDTARGQSISKTITVTVN